MKKLLSLVFIVVLITIITPSAQADDGETKKNTYFRIENNHLFVFETKLRSYHKIPKGVAESCIYEVMKNGSTVCHTVTPNPTDIEYKLPFAKVYSQGRYSTLVFDEAHGFSETEIQYKKELLKDRSILYTVFTYVPTLLIVLFLVFSVKSVKGYFLVTTIWLASMTAICGLLSLINSIDSTWGFHFGVAFVILTTLFIVVITYMFNLVNFPVLITTAVLIGIITAAVCPLVGALGWERADATGYLSILASMIVGGGVLNLIRYRNTSFKTS